MVGKGYSDTSYRKGEGGLKYGEEERSRPDDLQTTI